jgi:MraZ protein
MSYDKQGRILLSTELIDYAKIDKQVTIIGLINKIEIWNPSLLKKFDQQVLSHNKEAFDALAEKIIL